MADFDYHGHMHTANLAKERLIDCLVEAGHLDPEIAKVIKCDWAVVLYKNNTLGEEWTKSHEDKLGNLSKESPVLSVQQIVHHKEKKEEKIDSTAERFKELGTEDHNE